MDNLDGSLAAVVKGKYTSGDSAMKVNAHIPSPVLLLLRLGLAAVFLYSAAHHLQDPIALVIKVSEYDILPAKWVESFALVMPWAMVGTSVLLILGLATRPAAGAQGLMLLSFIIAVGVNIYRDKVMGCGCFSEQGSRIGWPLVVQDVSLLLLGLTLVFQGGGKWSFDTVVYRYIIGGKLEALQ